jgi:3-keto-5-aminohexanoate cleavage enzyme
VDPLVITVAGIGAELTREQQPNLPITPDEIAADAAACRDAGASIYHLHVRDADGSPTMDVAAFERALTAIRSATDLVVQFTSGGAVTDTEDDRIAPLSLGPDMASLTTGTVNFGDEVFSNPLPLIRRFYARMLEVGIVPEFEIFEAGMVATARRLYEELSASHHQHYDFVLGVPGALPADPDVVTFLRTRLPEGASWSATGIGRAHLPITEQAIATGGHVRTGCEDVRYIEPGVLAESNAQLIDRVATMSRAAGREVADPEATRNLLGLSGS